MKKLLLMSAMMFGMVVLVSAQTSKLSKHKKQNEQAASAKKIALKIEAEKNSGQTSDRISKAPAAVTPVADKKR